MDARWPSIKEILEYLYATQGTIYKWIKERDLSVHLMEKFRKFRRDEVDKWVKSENAAR